MKKKILAVASLLLGLSMSITSFAYEKSSWDAYNKACVDANTFVLCDIITATDVNMRTGPGMKYPVYKVLPKGTVIYLNNDEDPSGWYEVWYDDNTYFIYGDYVGIVVNDNSVK